MLKYAVAFLLVFAGSLSATPLTDMMFLGAISAPGFFLFNVNGRTELLLCDQFFPNVTTEPYKATVATLADLTGTTLQGDPQALLKYQKVALLDLRAYLDPSLAPDVVRANRFIVDGQGSLTNGAVLLLQWVDAQNPANFPILSQFKIFANPITQEITGFENIPEPASVLMILTGLGVVAIAYRRRAGIRS